MNTRNQTATVAALSMLSILSVGVGYAQTTQVSSASSSGDRSNAFSMNGGGGPLMVVMVVMILAMAYIAGLYIKTVGEKKQLKAGLTKVICAVEEEGATGVKERVREATREEPRVHKTIEDILNATVRVEGDCCTDAPAGQ